MADTADKHIYAVADWTGTIGAAGVSDSSVTTIPLASATGLTNGRTYVLTIDRVDSDGAPTAAKKEAVVGVLSGTDLIDCIRGFEGTAQAHDAGAVVELIMTAGQWNRQTEGILEEHNADGTHGDISLDDSTDFTTEHNADGTHGDVSLGDSTDFTTEHNTDGTHAIIDYTAIKQNLVTSSDGATVTFDLDTSNSFTVTLGGNRTLALSNGDNGQCFVIRLVQDGTGSRTVTWFSTIKWADGVTPTLTTTGGKADVFGFIQTSSGAYDGFIIGQNL
jgi:hypothetical protein